MVEEVSLKGMELRKGEEGLKGSRGHNGAGLWDFDFGVFRK
jgi:hypothetical protein